MLLKVATRVVKLDNEDFVLLRVQDVLPDLEDQLHSLRRTCNSMLVNALSHESFTPLNKILAMTDLILQHAKSLEHCKQQVALIHDTCDRMRLMMQSQIYQFKVEN